MHRRTVLTAAAALPALALPMLARAEGTSALHDELRALLARQAAQWSAGDLEGFCSHYADDAIFVSPSGRTDGRQAVHDRYQKKYVDKSGMGALSLQVLHVVADGKAASIMMKWRLAFDNKPQAEGYSLIGLERRGDAWKIAHDASM